MDAFWRRWLDYWCVAVGLFGLLVAGTGFTASDGGGRLWLEVIGEYELLHPDRGMRFATGILGAVTFGWAASLFVAFRSAHRSPVEQAPVWRGYSLAMLLWCVLDSTISIYNGFPVNAITNTLFLIAFLFPLHRSGYFNR